MLNYVGDFIRDFSNYRIELSLKKCLIICLCGHLVGLHARHVHLVREPQAPLLEPHVVVGYLIVVVVAIVIYVGQYMKMILWGVVGLGVLVVVVMDVVKVVLTLKKRLHVIMEKHPSHGIIKYYLRDMNVDGRQSFGLEGMLTGVAAPQVIL